MKEMEVNKLQTLAQFAAELRTLRARLKTEQLILEDMRPLQAEGAASRNMLLQQENQVLSIQSQIEQTNARKITYLSDYRSRLRQLETERDIAKVNSQYELVRAPVSGIVFEQNAREKGVLNAGMAIMKIIPQDGLTAEVKVTNKDIGFVKIGQKQL